MPSRLRNTEDDTSPHRPVTKNAILTEAGRSPWYRTDGTTVDTYVIGIAGGSASGKTRVAQAILKQLGVPWVLVVAQDMFYKSLTPEQSAKAFKSEYDFDIPDAFDFDVLKQCILDLKQSRAVQIPNYSFVKHQRTDETTYLYGATVVIVEGIFALHDPEIRALMDLKVFVQCDSDLMLARRLRRDLVERGRDPSGILDQYLRFVKPSFDSHVLPTQKHADIIVRGFDNETAIGMITSHIRRKLEERKGELRRELFEDVVVGKEGGLVKVYDGEGGREEGLPGTVLVMEQTSQLKGIHTILRDRSTDIKDFIFMANRVGTLVIELALTLLPTSLKTITTGTHLPFTGPSFAVSQEHVCGVSILRSGAALEVGLRRVLHDAPVGSMLIQSDATNGEPLLYHLSLPECITSSPSSAAKTWVLLLDSQIGTGAAALMGVRTLLDHGVPEEQIVFCVILASRVGGVWALKRAFPGVRVVTSAVDGGLEERWVWPDGSEGKEGGGSVGGKKGDAKPKKVFAILPGMGSFGDRYYGT